jgi:hypothetical protein
LSCSRPADATAERAGSCCSLLMVDAGVIEIHLETVGRLGAEVAPPCRQVAC